MPVSFGKGAEKVRDFRDRLGDEITDSVQDSTSNLARELRRRLTYQNSVASRTLISALYPDTNETSQYLTDERITAPDYWKYVEYGTGLQGDGRYESPSGGGGGTLYNAILAWIVAKGIQPRRDDISGIYELAEVISASIVEEGTEPHPFVRRTFRGPNGKRAITSSVSRAMRRAKRRSF